MCRVFIRLITLNTSQFFLDFALSACSMTMFLLRPIGKLPDNIRVTDNGLVSGVDRMFMSSDSAFKHITN